MSITIFRININLAPKPDEPQIAFNNAKYYKAYYCI